MISLRFFALGLALTTALVPFAFGRENWPQWRGPYFNGSTKEVGLPATLSGENLVWRTPLPGRAGSTPIVWNDQVILTTPNEGKNLTVVALDRRTGTQHWVYDTGIPDKEKSRNNLCAPTPVTDGATIYALFGSGDLVALHVSGRVVWKRSLQADFGRFAVMWIYGSSPLLYEGKLYVQVLQRDEMPSDYPLYDGKPKRESFLLCLNPADGTTLWRHVRHTDSTKESHESYATPIPHLGKNGPEIVVVGGDHVSAHATKDGAELWRARLYEKRDDWYRIVTSAVAQDGLIYASGPKGQPVVAFRDGGHGDVTATHRAWEYKENPTDWATPLLLDGKLFVMDGGKRVLSRLDAVTGEVKWTGRLEVPDNIWSSPNGADGKIYLRSEAGTVLVCAAGDEFKVLSRYQLPADEAPCFGSVALAHGHVFVRSAKALYCFGAK